MNFGDFAGNEKIKERLTEMIEKKRIVHTIIFEGRKGLGKKTVAELFAKAVLCTRENKPCGVCPQCEKFSAMSHPDVKIIDGSNPKSISIEAMRAVRSDAFIKPNEAQYKIYIILNADEMRVEAQNALLKILEEPPVYCVFIFTCESRSSFLPTILSRAVSLELFPPKTHEAVAAVLKALPNVNSEDAEKAVRLFSGNVGCAVSSLSGGGFSQAFTLTADILKSLTAQNEMELLAATASFENDKEMFSSCVSMLTLAVRDALVQRYGMKKGMSGFENDDLSPLQALTAKQLIAVGEELSAISAALNRNSNYTLLLTRFCSRLRMAAGR